MAGNVIVPESEWGFMVENLAEPIHGVNIDIRDLNDPKTLFSISRETHIDSYNFHARNAHLGITDVVGTVLTSPEPSSLKTQNLTAPFPSTVEIKHSDGNKYQYIKVYIKDHGLHGCYPDPCVKGLNAQQVVMRMDYLPWIRAEDSKTPAPKVGDAVTIGFKHGPTMGQQRQGTFSKIIARQGSSRLNGRCIDALKTNAQHQIQNPAAGQYKASTESQKQRARMLSKAICESMSGHLAGAVPGGGMGAGSVPSGGGNHADAQTQFADRSSGAFNSKILADAKGDDIVASNRASAYINQNLGPGTPGPTQKIWDQIYQLESEGLISNPKQFYQQLVSGLMVMAEQESGMDPFAMGDSPEKGTKQKYMTVTMANGKKGNFRSFGLFQMNVNGGEGQSMLQYYGWHKPKSGPYKGLTWDEIIKKNPAEQQKMLNLLQSREAQVEFTLASKLGAYGGKKADRLWEDLRMAKKKGPGYGMESPHTPIPYGIAKGPKVTNTDLAKWLIHGFEKPTCGKEKVGTLARRLKKHRKKTNNPDAPLSELGGGAYGPCPHRTKRVLMAQGRMLAMQNEGLTMCNEQALAKHIAEEGQGEHPGSVMYTELAQNTHTRDDWEQLKAMKPNHTIDSGSFQNTKLSDLTWAEAKKAAADMGSGN